MSDILPRCSDHMPSEKGARGSLMNLLPFVPSEPAGIQHFSFTLSFPPPSLARSLSLTPWCHCFLPSTFWCLAQCAQTPQINIKYFKKYDLYKMYINKVNTFCGFIKIWQTWSKRLTEILPSVFVSVILTSVTKGLWTLASWDRLVFLSWSISSWWVSS